MIFKDELNVLKDLYETEKLQQMFEEAYPKEGNNDSSKIIIYRTGGEFTDGK